MEPCFAPVEKAEEKILASEIELVSRNPMVTGLLHSIGGLLAILDEHRQIVGLNDSFLDLLGVPDPSEALGLRLGEALNCIHANEEPGHTCGGGRLCSSCGAAIAMVTSLGQQVPAERICALSTQKNGKPMELALRVTTKPILIEGKRFLLVFLQDITKQQQRAALERTFFHDINNMLNLLDGASELLIKQEPSELARTIRLASTRLINEVAIQRALTESEAHCYQPMWNEFTTEQILEELRLLFASHPAAQGKLIEFSSDCPEVSIQTDLSLVSRVLSNMLLNALEATPVGSTVTLRVMQGEDGLSFMVWNAQEIPADIAGRIFQRNFSTKREAGRGTGTFSMKLFGEEILGGEVSLTTSKTEGTTFRFSLPL